MNQSNNNESQPAPNESPSIHWPKEPLNVRSLTLGLLALLALLYTLFYARLILIPFTVALLINLLLAPLVQRLRRWGIPNGFSAAVLLLSLVGVLGGAGYYLSEPAKEWLRDAPTSLRELGRELERQPGGALDDIKEIGKEVDQITEIDEESDGRTQAVEIKEPGTIKLVMQQVPVVITSTIITLFIAFFLLAGGDRLASKLVTLGRSWSSRRQIIKVSRRIQAEVSRYLLTVTLINLALGGVVAGLMWLLEVPNPLLWGAMVAVFNFAPYVGAVLSALVLTVVGISTFPTLGEALMVPGVFLLATSLEGALITPMVVGQRLALSPLVVFLSVIVWGWLWGPAGALIAVPLVSSLKVLLDHIQGTRPIANLMEG